MFFICLCSIYTGCLHKLTQHAHAYLSSSHKINMHLLLLIASNLNFCSTGSVFPLFMILPHIQTPIFALERSIFLHFVVLYIFFYPLMMEWKHIFRKDAVTFNLHAYLECFVHYFVNAPVALICFECCWVASSAQHVLDNFFHRSSKILSSSAKLDVCSLWTACFRFLHRFSIPISRPWQGHCGSFRDLSWSHLFWLCSLGYCHVERWTFVRVGDFDFVQWSRVFISRSLYI